MTPIQRVVTETIACARARDWPGYRLRFAALRAALEPSAADDMRRHLDILAAAAPEHDAEGCVAELETLGALLGANTAAVQVDLAVPAIDLRGLRPPEPMVRIMDALEREPGKPLRVILPHEPVPLYNLLAQRGLRWSGTVLPSGAFELLIEQGDR